MRAPVCGITAGIVLLFVCFAAGAALGETKRPGMLFAGIQVGYSPDNIGGFTRYGCFGKEQRAEWFLGARLRAYLAIRATHAFHDAFDVVCPVESPEPPIPQHGPYTRRLLEFGDDIQKHPYYASEIDLIAEPLPARWIASLRMLAGYGWIWRKDIPLWLAGVGIAAGNERVRFVCDIKKYWFEVPYERVTYLYQDGILVDRQVVSRCTNEHPLAIVAGVEFDIPWPT